MSQNKNRSKLSERESLEKKRAFLVKIVGEAGVLLKDYFTSRNFSVKSKKGVEIITEADDEVDKKLREQIKAVYADSEFLTEETAPNDFRGYEKKRNLFIIDPIDGTTNFSRGRQNFSISIALVDEGVTQVAVIGVPMIGKIYEADRINEHALVNGNSIEVSDTSDLSRATFACDWPYDLNKKMQMVEILKRLTEKGNVRSIISGGSAAADLAALAEGQSDIYVIPTLKPWDVAAASLLIEKAGGKVTRLDGKQWDIFQAGDGILVSNGCLHNELVWLFE
ncbi:MAG: hypothetical protein A3I29_04050 [Candidatus Magasanikbacteria bacterium RIFCSPLOWO2_02_FULL_44_11]|uniref:Inositol-phosphate phosphatase n=2 Tax=Candidatus Magasanikiibacteriota TaxID=1752731 RepID=A0A1F6N9J2_9BACT|nr:MAG: hypothetical protein A3D53_02935 [Candidatus Magasanikbacteria bacterium RIFCSPHIGHO2_02_FULL_45_10]OGH80586.1 MAG: hypothetical protein A3I29_04050 [Candidatus Magasanikbacteria bacterium RIFCSPLOWO2_02_FULL_44_11]